MSSTAESDVLEFLQTLGYDRAHLLVATVGPRGARAAYAVTVTPADVVAKLPVDQRAAHCKVLVSLHHDRPKAARIRQALAQAAEGCVFVDWHPQERSVFWCDDDGTLRAGSLDSLPRAPVGNGNGNGRKPQHLTLRKLRDDVSLLAVFDRVEDVLHTHGIAKQDRYEVILHLLLAKLFDERTHAAAPDDALLVQPWRPREAPERFADVLRQVVQAYGDVLHRPLSTTLPVKGPTLADALAVLAPVRIGGASRSALQDFFMRFARDLYKWDMAQYFTPTPLTEFVVEVVSPNERERVTDPAAGSGDFLMAAFERDYGEPHLKPWLNGIDISPTAVRVAELNKVLHEAHRCRFDVADSLVRIGGDGSAGFAPVLTGSHVVVCNPPFGRRIRVQDQRVLQQFDLGRLWRHGRDGRWQPTDEPLRSQEAGMLFVEACVRLAMPAGGRVAIVLPNGYLGNRRPEYLVLREWLLRHTYVVAVLSFPRFTFKGSGADVSASLLVLARRPMPLARSDDADDYDMAVELIERVGWDVTVKNGGMLHRRQADGSLHLDGGGEPVVDADFADVLARLRASTAGERFPWLAERADARAATRRGHTVPISRVLADPHRCLDPKRHSAKYLGVRAAIEAVPHFRLGDVAKAVPELRAAEVRLRSPSALYRYVEIADVGAGMYLSGERRGWELPSRARHGAEQGDVFVGGIWGSVSKWFVAGPEDDLVVTNGFRRLRVDDEHLLDVVVGLCSEAFAVQMRALALGSDGLAEVTEEDLLDVVLPFVADEDVRSELGPVVDWLRQGQTSLKSRVDALLREGALPFPQVPPRPSHVALV